MVELKDNHGRTINYLRLAVTDRCNLRCFYCMPEQGIDLLPRAELLSYEEILLLCSVLIKMGIEKIRITGGEPFVRKDMMQLLAALSAMEGLKELTITTNGVRTAPLIPELKKMGIRSVNLSLDTLDRNRFFSITRRDELHHVLDTLDQLLYHGMEVKLNAVVMEDRNTEDILPLAELTRTLPVSVRFIEEMPFNGTGHIYSGINWNYIRILETVKQQYPELQKLSDPPHSTSYNYKIPGFNGTIGVIAAYTRSFCGTCNRIRITPKGILKICLYDEGVLDVKSLIRKGLGTAALQNELMQALQQRAKDGWEAERNKEKNRSGFESMASIGG